MIVDVNLNPLGQFEMIKDRNEMLLDRIYTSDKRRRKHHMNYIK